MNRKKHLYKGLGIGFGIGVTLMIFSWTKSAREKIAKSFKFNVIGISEEKAKTETTNKDSYSSTLSKAKEDLLMSKTV